MIFSPEPAKRKMKCRYLIRKPRRPGGREAYFCVHPDRICLTYKPQAITGDLVRYCLHTPKSCYLVRNESVGDFSYPLSNLGICDIYTNISREIAREGEIENEEIENQAFPKKEDTYGQDSKNRHGI